MITTGNEIEINDRYIKSILSPPTINKVLQELSRILGFILESDLILTPEEKNRYKGGYLCIAEMTHGTPQLLCMVGQIATDYVDKCKKRAEESAQKVAAFHLLSSWENRNADQDKFGGAIHADGAIISFHGFPEWVDEAISVSIAHSLRQIDDVTIQKISTISCNPFIQILIKNKIKKGHSRR